MGVLSHVRGGSFLLVIAFGWLSASLSSIAYFYLVWCDYAFSPRFFFWPTKVVVVRGLFGCCRYFLSSTLSMWCGVSVVLRVSMDLNASLNVVKGGESMVEDDAEVPILSSPKVGMTRFGAPKL